jgi:glycine dehydrogenase subunit 1
MPYLSLTEDEKRTILGEIGVRSFDELIRDIPGSLRDPKIALPSSLTELEIQDLIGKLGRKNTSTKDSLSFLGAGSYEHFIPAAALEIAGRQEFLTAYTPYQPEA